jgi:hypothetical protein
VTGNQQVFFLGLILKAEGTWMAAGKGDMGLGMGSNLAGEVSTANASWQSLNYSQNIY